MSVNEEQPVLTVEQACDLAALRGQMRKYQALVLRLTKPVYYGDWERAVEMLDALLEPWDHEHTS